MKFKKTVQKCLECEFTAHYICRSVEMKLKSTTFKGFNL